MSDEPPADRLPDRVRRELREAAATPDRLASVVTEDVPSPAPGRVLLCFARGCTGAAPVEDALDAAVAVEFAALHQYLHAIPTAAGLEAPARDSPYADDEVAAIIDSDWLQAAAFARVSAAAPTPEASRRCYAVLAAGSTGCYERRRDGEAAPADAPLTPLIAAAGRIGAIVAGLDREAGATAAAVASAVGESARIRTPTGVVGGGSGGNGGSSGCSGSSGGSGCSGAAAGAGPGRASIREDLDGVVPEPAAVVDALSEIDALQVGASLAESTDSVGGGR